MICRDSQEERIDCYWNIMVTQPDTIQHEKVKSQSTNEYIVVRISKQFIHLCLALRISIQKIYHITISPFSAVVSTFHTWMSCKHKHGTD
jgi:hypothetical protein